MKSIRFDFSVQRQRDSSCYIGREWRSSSLACALSYFTRPCSRDFASPSPDAKNTEAKKSKWNFNTPKRAVQRVHCASHACLAALYAHRSGNRVKGEKVIFGSWESGSRRFEISTARHEVFVWDIDCVWRAQISARFYIFNFVSCYWRTLRYFCELYTFGIWKMQSNASIHLLKWKKVHLVVLIYFL